MPSNSIIANVILIDLDLLFRGQTSNENGESLRKAARGDICRCQHLPLNTIIANVVLFDLDLVSQGKMFQMSVSRKTVRASAKVLMVCLNGLDLYPDKSDAIIFGNWQRSRTLPSLTSIEVTGCMVPVSSDVKILGVTLDCALSLNKHVGLVSKVYRLSDTSGNL